MRPTRLVAAAGLFVAAAALVWPGFWAGPWAGLGRAEEPRVVRIAAKMFEYDPPKVILKRGQPVVLELTSTDRPHGFLLVALGIRAELLPGQVARFEVIPERAGSFMFACNVFCGLGHDDMDGTIVIED